jgi:hypothetical protein
MSTHFPIHPLQALVNGMNEAGRQERAQTQMTLGGLIAALEALPPERVVDGMCAPMSYRGYYSDLAFDPVGSMTVGELLAVARGCMGKVFIGYKGGDFMMGETSPVWISPYGASTDARLMSLDATADPIRPVTEPSHD